MKLIVIFGPPAVGKMSVGHQLAKLTGLKLFHNHMTIELVLNFFRWEDPPFWKLANEFRRRIFEEVAACNLPGMIFTYVWALNEPRDKDYVDKICEIFRARGAEIYFVELEATLDARLHRNKGEFRLEHKPSKRDIAESERKMMEHIQKYRFNSAGDFYYAENYLKIENTNLPPAEAAMKIVERFELQRV